jgi:phosphatidylserine decarboxylase
VRIDRAGLPFIALACLPALAAAMAGARLPAVGLLVLPFGIGLFFRDPERIAPQDSALVLAPADGTVRFAGPAQPGEAPPGDWQQVTIFLSLLDVHINRTPVTGRVTHVEHVAGTFLPAYRPEAARNERSEVWIDHAGVPIVVRQVVGVLARRVVCRVRAGDVLGPGARIGLMKFGSRMDVFVPVTAALAVQAGQQVRAAVTVIARLAAQGTA